jgi:hypothetical protein
MHEKGSNDDYMRPHVVGFYEYLQGHSRNDQVAQIRVNLDLSDSIQFDYIT